MKQQRGNILFLILLAVILFAALSYAVTRGERGQVQSVSPERAQTLASQMVQAATLTENSLRRFILSTDLPPGKIDLFKTGFTSNGDVTGCASSTCNLYDPAGGNVTVPMLPAEAFDTAAANCSSNYGPLVDGRPRPRVFIASVNGIGTDLPELVLVTCGVKIEVCRAINYAMGLMKAGDADIANKHGAQASNDYQNYSGNVYPLPVTNAGQFGVDDARVKGQRTFCSYDNPSNNYGNWFYHVLWEQ